MHTGIVYAALAFVWWGLFPLYFRIVTTVPAPEILAHRVVDSAAGCEFSINLIPHTTLNTTLG